MTSDTFAFKVATVLTVYGIETFVYHILQTLNITIVATVLTVYGIETLQNMANPYQTYLLSCNSTYRLRY